MIISNLDEIFHDLHATKNFLTDNEIISESKICGKCGNNAILKIQKVGSAEELLYRCEKTGCQSRTRVCSSKCKIKSILNAIYLILLDVDYKQIYLLHGFSSATISKLKKAILKCCKKYMNKRPILIGGLGVVVEADETVLSRRGVIREPTSTDDSLAGTVWIVGVIDHTNEKNFFLKRVENRQVVTLTRLFESVICVESKLYSDGYPSYPGVARNLGIDHNVCNHTHGFVAEDGTHTNNIEGFWSHLKSSMRKENGVQRVNIDNWLIMYTFKRRYLMHCSRDEFAVIYIEILQYYFND